MKNKYRLIVDSSCDLPNDAYEKFNIGVTNLIINFGERSYYDRKDITAKEILDIYHRDKICPKTSALNIADLTAVFENNLKEYEHIFYMPISSGVSSVFNNARLASQAFGEDKVSVLDSQSLSCGSALEAFGIAKDIEDGLDYKEIIANHNERVKRVSMQFTFDNMELLYKGGRCSGMAFLLGNKLHLHPIIRLDNGKMSVYKLKRGKDISNSVDLMLEEFLEQLNAGNIDLSYPIMIPNVASPNGVKRVQKTLEKYVGDKILFPVDASGIICCHCGEDTTGLAYMLKEPLKKD